MAKLLFAGTHARGVSENDFKGIQAEWMDPKRFASLVAEYDRTVTI